MKRCFAWHHNSQKFWPKHSHERHPAGWFSPVHLVYILYTFYTSIRIQYCKDRNVQNASAVSFGWQKLHFELPDIGGLWPICPLHKSFSTSAMRESAVMTHVANGLEFSVADSHSHSSSIYLKLLTPPCHCIDLWHRKPGNQDFIRFPPSGSFKRVVFPKVSSIADLPFNHLQRSFLCELNWTYLNCKSFTSFAGRKAVVLGTKSSRLQLWAEVTFTEILGVQ